MKSAVITPAQRQLEDDIKAVVKNFDDQIAAIDRELPTIDRELEQLRAEYVRIWGDSDGDARRFSNRGQADIAEFEYDRARIKLAARKSELEGERTSLLKQREARVRTLIDSRPYGPSIPVAAFQLADFASDPQLQELRHRREAVAVSVGELTRRMPSGRSRPTSSNAHAERSTANARRSDPRKHSFATSMVGSPSAKPRSTIVVTSRSSVSCRAR